MPASFTRSQVDKVFKAFVHLEFPSKGVGNSTVTLKSHNKDSQPRMSVEAKQNNSGTPA